MFNILFVLLKLQKNVVENFLNNSVFASTLNT